MQNRQTTDRLSA